MKQVSLPLTIKKNFIVIEPEQGNNTPLNTNVLSLVMKLIKCNVLLDNQLISQLELLNQKKFNKIKKKLLIEFKPLKGDIFRDTFATGSNLEDELLTIEEYRKQIEHYIKRYNLNILDFPSKSNNRKINKDNISRKTKKQEINKNFRVISLKTPEEFKDMIKEILTLPIVFGESQKQYLDEANRLDILLNLLPKNFKIKENLFYLMKYNIEVQEYLKTSTDILRYAYYVSDLNYKELNLKEDNEYIKFKLKTSNKRIIMIALNLLSNNKVEVYGDMKPYKSQWLRLAANLFPGSAKFNKYPKSQFMFDILRNGSDIETFNMMKAKYISDSDMLGLTQLLTSKPGELLRSLDMIIRKTNNQKEFNHILSLLEKTNMNPKLLNQVIKWLDYRTKSNLKNRFFSFNGKFFLTDLELIKLDKNKTKLVNKILTNKIVSHLKGKELW